MRKTWSVALASIVLVGMSVIGWSASGAFAQDYEAMARFNEYKVIEAESNGTLAQDVTEALQNGWQPVGGVSVDGGFYVHSVGRK